VQPELAAIAAAQGGAFTYAQALKAGYTAEAIRYRVCRRRWVRLRRGVLAEREVWAAAQASRHAEHALEVAGALLLQPEGAAASHTSAGRLHRVPFVGGWPVAATLTVPPAAGQRRNAYRRRRVHRCVAPLPDDHVMTIGSLRVTTPARMLVELSKELDFPEATVVADAVLRDQLVERGDILAVVAACGGSRKPRRVVEFADPRAESPLESYGRAVLHEHGVPRLEPQVWLYDDRGLIGRVDGFLAECFTVVEFDGLVKYQDSGSLRAEKLRQERLEEAGFGVARATHEQLEREPQRTAGRVMAICRNALNRRVGAQPRDLTGYVGPPPDWWLRKCQSAQAG
jgi:hypothetical protein